MFYRIISQDIKICLTIPQFADEIFNLIDSNRSFLKNWLPWLDSTKSSLDTKAFIEAQLLNFAKGEALHVTAFYQDKIAGVLGFNNIDKTNRVGHIGYWLGENFNGKGIMTKCVSELITIGKDYFGLNRFEMRCAVENKKSRAIPERLGFVNEGIIRQAENVYGKYLDHVVYGLIK